MARMLWQFCFVVYLFCKRNGMEFHAIAYLWQHTCGNQCAARSCENLYIWIFLSRARPSFILWRYSDVGILWEYLIGAPKSSALIFCGIFPWAIKLTGLHSWTNTNSSSSRFSIVAIHKFFYWALLPLEVISRKAHNLPVINIDHGSIWLVYCSSQRNQCHSSAIIKHITLTMGHLLASQRLIFGNLKRIQK